MRKSNARRQRGSPDKCEIKREGKSKRGGGHQGIGLFRAPREPVDRPPGGEHAPAHSDGDNQRVIDRDLLQRHPFLTHEKEDCEIDQTVGNELCGAAGQCGEHERRPRDEHHQCLPESCFARAHLVRNLIQAAATGLRHQKEDADHCEKTDGAEPDKCIAPTESRGDGSAEGDSQR